MPLDSIRRRRSEIDRELACLAECQVVQAERSRLLDRAVRAKAAGSSAGVAMLVLEQAEVLCADWG